MINIYGRAGLITATIEVVDGDGEVESLLNKLVYEGYIDKWEETD